MDMAERALLVWLNLTAQFVGSYYWNMVLSGGFEASPALSDSSSTLKHRAAHPRKSLFLMSTIDQCNGVADPIRIPCVDAWGCVRLFDMPRVPRRSSSPSTRGPRSVVCP